MTVEQILARLQDRAGRQLYSLGAQQAAFVQSKLAAVREQQTALGTAADPDQQRRLLVGMVRDLKILRTRLVQFSGLVQLVDEAVLELRARETDLRTTRAPAKRQEPEKQPEAESPARSRRPGEAAQTIADQELTIFYLRQKVERLRERLAAGGADPGDGDELFRAQTEARFYEQMNAELVAERQDLREKNTRETERVRALEAQAEVDRRRIEELTRRTEAQDRLTEELRIQTHELRQVVERQAADGLAHFRTEQEAETLRRQVAQLEEQRTRYLDHIQEIEL